MLIRNTNSEYCLESITGDGCCCCNCIHSFTVLDRFGNPTGKLCKLFFKNENEPPLIVKLSSIGHGLCECWESTNKDLTNTFYG